MERAIDACAPLAGTWAHAAELLRGDPRRLLDGDGGTYELTVQVGATGAVHQEVELDLGPVREAEGELWVPLSWTPSDHRRVLPSFDGVLELLDGAAGPHLRISGTYTVPLGVVGRFGDGVVGRRVARQTLESLVADLARRVDAQTTVS
jgi:hypothetical protein